MIDFGGAQGIAAVDQDHLFGDAGKRQCIGHCGIAAADDRDGFAAKEHAVADRAVAETVPEQFFFTGQTELLGFRAGGQHDGPRQVSSGGCLDLFWVSRKMDRAYFGHFAFRAEAERTVFHLFTERKAVDAFVKSRIVIDLRGQRHLAAGRELFEDQHRKSGARGV